MTRKETRDQHVQKVLQKCVCQIPIPDKFFSMPKKIIKKFIAAGTANSIIYFHVFIYILSVVMYITAPEKCKNNLTTLPY